MKTTIRAISFAILMGSGISFTSCNNNDKNQEEMTTTQDNAPLFPRGEKRGNEWFSGDAYLYPLLDPDENNEFSMGSVTFGPGGRTHWHTHPKGQVLIVTEGQGWYQEKGKPAQVIKKGDVINIPEDVEHWHGASAHSGMTHIALTNLKDGENVVWLDPVTEEEFNEVNQ